MRAKSHEPIGPHQHCPAQGYLPLAQPSEPHVGEVGVIGSDRPGLQGDSGTLSDLSGCLDPRRAILAGDQQELAAVCKVLQRKRLATPGDEGVRQRMASLVLSSYSLTGSIGTCTGLPSSTIAAES